jgi:hypothetical protein
MMFFLLCSTPSTDDEFGENLLLVRETMVIRVTVVVVVLLFLF